MWSSKNVGKPLRHIALEQFNYVAFEGNIGAGKTTLATKIAEDFNAKTVLERFADNPFYQTIKIKTDMLFRLKCLSYDRYQQLSDDLAIWFV
jgi:tRNA A37 threonylcarbamoyladenosine biosynthesis protein TsaE